MHARQSMINVLNSKCVHCSQQSNMLNAARLKVLKAREDHVGNVLEESKRRLGEITKDSGKYKRLLHSLITQGLLQLLEQNVLVRCRQQDLGLVQEVMDGAKRDYTEKTGKDVNIKLDQEAFLSANM